MNVQLDVNCNSFTDKYFSKKEEVIEYLSTLLSSDVHSILLRQEDITWVGINAVAVMRTLATSHIEKPVTTLETSQQTYYDYSLEYFLDAIGCLQLSENIPLLLGFFSYEYLHLLEKIPLNTQSSIQKFPLAYFSFYDTVLKVSNKKIRSYSLQWSVNEIVLEPITSPPYKVQNYSSQHTISALDTIDKCISYNKSLNSILKCTFSKKEYIEACDVIKDQILDGDYYQVNISQQVSFQSQIPRKKLIKRVLESQSAFRSAVVNCLNNPLLPPLLILSLSPELFFELNSNKIKCEPIKGTAPRGFTEEEDSFLLEHLLTSQKNNAELAMIVDLIRNDLNKICCVGTVRVIKHAHALTLSNVHHTFSSVIGNIAPSTTLSGIIKALFPCGSITGAPKIAAMKSIATLEKSQRDIYCGAIGYFGAQRSHFNVAIRTCINSYCKDENCDRVTLYGGGGVTLKSTGEDEYIETLHKLRSSAELFK
jgi:para-aminobenzoate synthetase component I